MAKKDKSEKEKFFDTQFDDEEVLHVFRKHPIVMRKGLVFGAFAPLLGVLPAAIKPELGMGWFFGGLVAGILLWGLVLFPFWINWFYSIFIVTDQRLIQITQKGLFHKTVVDLALNQIQMVNYQVAGLQETLLGYGTIMIQTYVGDLVIHNVHHPAKIQKIILNILKEEGINATSLPTADKEMNEEAEA
jgi:hypothetical protein